MSFLWTVAAKSFLSLCGCGSYCLLLVCVQLGKYHMPYSMNSNIPLIRKWTFCCVFFSLFGFSVSIHPSIISPPVRPTARFFLRLTQSDSAVTFHLMSVTRPLKVMFSPSSSCLPSKLFWDVSRDKPKLCSSVPKNLRSWLRCEHLPKIGPQRLLHPPNSSSFGHSCALYYQNVKEIMYLCADTDIQNNTSYLC